jgi:tetratricopeptide (TPR) repeat protein
MDELVQKQIKTAQSQLLALTSNPNAKSSELSEAYGRLGELYEAYALRDSAARCYQNAHALNPGEFKWSYYLGHLFQSKGDFDQALVHYQDALLLRSDDEMTLLRLGDVNLALNRLDEAKGFYDQVLALHASSVPALAGLGKTALATRQYASAVDYLNRALTLDPSALSLHYPLAMAYRGLGDKEQSQAHMEKQGPRGVQAHDPLLEELEGMKTGKTDLWVRGSQAMNRGDFATAVQVYSKLVSLTPKDPSARTYLGTALARAGDERGAVQTFSEALRLAPQDPQAHYCLGVVLAHMGKDEEAIPQFRTAMQLDPQLAAAHFQLANLLMRTHRDSAAAAEYKRVVEQDGNNAFAWVMEAMALVRLGQYAGARSCLERAHAALPENVDIANALARLLAACPDKQARNGNRALELMQQVIKRQKSLDVDQGETLAMALAEAGQFDKAVKLQRWVIDTLQRDNRPDLLPALRENLARYEHSTACRIPWRKDDPIFVPVPGPAEFPAGASLASQTSAR